MSRIVEVAKKLGVEVNQVPNPLSRGAAKEVGQLLQGGMKPADVLARLQNITLSSEQLGLNKPIQTDDVLANARRVAILKENGFIQTKT